MFSAEFLDRWQIFEKVAQSIKTPFLFIFLKFVNRN
jgi:hypothetical protein